MARVKEVGLLSVLFRHMHLSRLCKLLISVFVSIFYCLRCFSNQFSLSCPDSYTDLETQYYQVGYVSLLIADFRTVLCSIRPPQQIVLQAEPQDGGVLLVKILSERSTVDSCFED